VWASRDMVNLIKTRQKVTEGKPLTRFVISNAKAGTRISNEIKDAIQDYEIPILSSRTTNRTSYPSTISDGKTIFQSQDTEAKNEIKWIMEELLTMEVFKNDKESNK